MTFLIEPVAVVAWWWLAVAFLTGAGVCAGLLAAWLVYLEGAKAWEGTR